MWTRRIPVHPVATTASSPTPVSSSNNNNNKQPESALHRSASTPNEKSSSSSAQKQKIDFGVTLSKSQESDLKKKKLEEENVDKEETEEVEEKKLKEVKFTSLGTSDSFDERASRSSTPDATGRSTPTPPVPSSSSSSSSSSSFLMSTRASTDKTKRPIAPPKRTNERSSSSSGTSSSSSSSSVHHERPGLEIVVHNLAPEAFRAVRKTFGFSFKKFAASLGAAPLIPKGNGGGRSGARFFLSHDNRFVVKSIILEEVHVLLNILPDYLEHVISNSVHTLLPRFLGLFRVCQTRLSQNIYMYNYVDLKMYIYIYMYIRTHRLLFSCVYVCPLLWVCL
jgi:hypothetical protein